MPPCYGGGRGNRPEIKREPAAAPSGISRWGPRSVGQLAVGALHESEGVAAKLGCRGVGAVEVDAGVTAGVAVDAGGRRVADVPGHGQAVDGAGAGAVVGEVVDGVHEPVDRHVPGDGQRAVDDQVAAEVTGDERVAVDAEAGQGAGIGPARIEVHAVGRVDEYDA